MFASEQDDRSSETSPQRVVLVVEDDPTLRGILAEALVSEGHAVLTVANGEEAMGVAGTLVGRLALVITDILLPGMDGVDVADKLAKLNPSPSVLFISGVKPDRALPGPVLNKPFGPTAFLEEVGRLLSERSASGAGAED